MEHCTIIESSRLENGTLVHNQGERVSNRLLSISTLQRPKVQRSVNSELVVTKCWDLFVFCSFKVDNSFVIRNFLLKIYVLWSFHFHAVARSFLPPESIELFVFMDRLAALSVFISIDHAFPVWSSPGLVLPFSC